jgi:hypothetical protein
MVPTIATTIASVNIAGRHRGSRNFQTTCIKLLYYLQHHRAVNDIVIFSDFGSRVIFVNAV